MQFNRNTVLIEDMIEIIEIAYRQNMMEKQGCFAFNLKKKVTGTVIDAWLFNELGERVEIKDYPVPQEAFSYVNALLAKEEKRVGKRENLPFAQDLSDYTLIVTYSDRSSVSLDITSALRLTLESYLKALVSAGGHAKSFAQRRILEE